MQISNAIVLSYRFISHVAIIGKGRVLVILEY